MIIVNGQRNGGIATLSRPTALKRQRSECRLLWHLLNCEDGILNISNVDIYGALTVMMQIHTYNQPLTGIIGTWRRFGLVGPVYQVIREGDALPNGDRLMRICIVETGEEVDYRLTSILDDPRER